MQDKKISEFEEQTFISADDEFPFIRNMGDYYENYKVKQSNLFSLSPATTDSLGGVKIGTGINIDADGTISSFKYSSRIYVSPDGNDNSDGRSPETAKRTIKAAARLATTTTTIETIYVGTGEFIEDNPIYLPPGTAVIGDNLRRTRIKALNEGRDIFWWSSGCYVNYLVFQDNYFGGVGILDTSTQTNNRELSATGLSFKVFPGHSLQRLPGVYKDGAGLIAFQRNSIINGAYSYMLSLNPGLVIPGGGEETCKRDIGYFVDAIANDLKAGGNVNSIKVGKAYRDANGNLIPAIATEITQTKQAFTRAKELCKVAITNVPSGYGSVVDTSNPGACTQVSNTIDSLSEIAISIIDGGDIPQYNSGAGYILIDQEWIEVLDISNNTITVANVDKRGVNNPITGANSTNTKHINGAVISQAGRAFRYAVAFPDQDGYWGKGRISISGNTVTGVGTHFTKETFVNWKLKVGATSYTINSIDSDTLITLTASGTSQTSKAYKVIPKPEQILLSPYIQNCSNISVLGSSYFDPTTQDYDVNQTRAGGMLVDGDQLDPGTAIPSNVADAFTQIAFGGVGFHLKNDGYAQLVSVFQVFDDVGVLCESGGYASITNSATNFGKEGLKAIGFSKAAVPSFKNAVVSAISNQTKSNFNTTSTEILATSFSSASGGTKTRVTISVAGSDITKFEAGQLVTISGHTSTPSINGTGIAITGVKFSENIVEIEVNTPYLNTFTNGFSTGSIVITSGKVETKVTVSGFKENPLANYIVKITGLPAHPSGAEYVVSDLNQELEGGVCQFTLQQVVPSSGLAALTSNPAIELRAPSTVNSSSHTYEYVGAGINYNALPINGGRVDKSKQAVEVKSGKCYVSATDQEGNFNVGNYFNVNLRTGQITFAGQLNLGVIDALELLSSPGVPIYEFVTTIRSQINSKHTAVPTEKAVREFVTANLGSLFNKQPTTSGGTPTSAGQLVELTSEGIIDPSMIRIPVSNIYTVTNEAARLVASISGVALKVGDYVVQLNPSPSTRYILKALPATNAANWDVFSADSFDASSITSGIISPARIASSIANTNTFPNGGGTWVPVVQSVKAASNSPIQIGTEPGTTPVSSGNAGFVELDVNRASYFIGQTSGSSSLGIGRYAFDEFNIDNSNVISIKGKLKTVASPLVFDVGIGALSIQQSSTTQDGFLSAGDWNTFNNKQPALGYTPLNPSNNLSDVGNISTARTNLQVYSKTEVDSIALGGGGGGSLSNGILINGVSHIYQNTKPTTRPSGSALVVGDLWYNPSTGVKGFWNGTYWLSCTQLFSPVIFYNATSGQKQEMMNFGKNKNILIDKVYFRVGQLTGTNPWSNTNFWTFTLLLGYSTFTFNNIITQAIKSPTDDVGLDVPLNLVIPAYPNAEVYSQLTCTATATGSPGGLYGSISFSFYEVLS